MNILYMTVRELCDELAKNYKIKQMRPGDYDRDKLMFSIGKLSFVESLRATHAPDLEAIHALKDMEPKDVSGFIYTEEELEEGEDMDAKKKAEQRMDTLEAMSQLDNDTLLKIFGYSHAYNELCTQYKNQIENTNFN